MRFLTLSLLLLAFPAVAAPADGMATCSTRHAEIAKQASTYNGEALTKRLIEADLKRAMKEQAEGDGDECIVALDHAAKLLAGGA